ncbi:MAG TPA: M67 family metallopeptidase [Flavisolibacter sp.]|nr:M67 family metallopeptidase [Flavisolibacter sp.]
MIIVEHDVRNKMIADAESSFPDECCGFVFGYENGEKRFLTEVLIVNNVKEGDKRRRFEIAPKDYMWAEQYADEHQLQLLGVYHSHPNHPAVPSEHDRIAAQPFFSYIILSVLNGSISHMRSWQLNEALQFEEETLQYPLINNQIK